MCPFLYSIGWCVAVCQISSEFMLGFVQSIDGEKDPRNLLIVFDTVPLMAAHLNLGEWSRVIIIIINILGSSVLYCMSMTAHAVYIVHILLLILIWVSAYTVHIVVCDSWLYHL